MLSLCINSGYNHFTFYPIVRLHNNSLRELVQLDWEENLAKNSAEDGWGSKHLVPEPEIEHVNQAHQHLENGNEQQKYQIEDLDPHGYFLGVFGKWVPHLLKRVQVSNKDYHNEAEGEDRLNLVQVLRPTPE